ncbi:MAG: DEAD/DEAH box helicase [Acidobacteria bacterium]|nr:MAG: DEAD/DEAH box helicase [Acidobacteriota bacterium]
MTESTSLSPPKRELDRLDVDHVRELLGEGSPLETALPAFEYRRSQQDMAAAVAEAFRDGGELLVEAGTGTGKTLAYLIPAVLSGQRVVVSTGTKNLQEQLFYKDIPLLRKAMKVPFTACLMKGRGNYLCLTRHAQFAMQPNFRQFQEASHFDTVERWAGITKTGDRAEIPGIPDRLDFWKGISARSENCTGRDCSEFERCYVTKIRQRAAESDIIIVNHHLLFADLMVRAGSYGEVLPEYDYLILDEFHQIEDVATQYFGLIVSNVRVEDLVRDCEEAWKTRAHGKRVSQAQLQLRRLRNSGLELFESFRGRDERYRLEPKALMPAQERLRDSFVKELAKVRSELSGIPTPDEVTVSLSRRASEIEMDLLSILAASDPEAVSWCDQRERSVALRSSPIHVAPFLQASLFERKHAVVMTSATLAVDDSFEYMGSRLGVATDRCMTLPSPFDYREQALLYVARHLPPPREKAFMDEAIAEIRSLLAASRGRAFVLFTSFQNLRATKRAFEGNLPYPLLVHGDAPRGELLERFRETPGAVLLGTSSFWEGVDVMGEQLSCVIVDKLPFAVPGDPLVSARIDLVASSGGNGFADYQVPMAILSLKQGFGRLIRSKTDRGVVAILDSRVANMGYGKRFLSSLPPYRLTYDRRDVTSFFEAPRAPSA